MTPSSLEIRSGALVAAMALALTVALTGALACSESEEPQETTDSQAQAPVTRDVPAPAPPIRPAPIVKPEAKTLGEELAATVDLPANYPADAPAYPNTKPNTTGVRNGRIMAAFHTTDPLADVTDWADGSLSEQGWENVEKAEMPNGTIIQGFKGPRNIQVLLSTVNEGTRDVTLIVIATDPM